MATYTDGSAIACRFVPERGAESHGADKTLTIMPAQVRLPLGTTVTAKDRIKITKRFGVPLGTAMVFAAADAGVSGATWGTVNRKDVD